MFMECLRAYVVNGTTSVRLHYVWPQFCNNHWFACLLGIHVCMDVWQDCPFYKKKKLVSFRKRFGLFKGHSPWRSSCICRPGSTRHTSSPRTRCSGRGACCRRSPSRTPRRWRTSSRRSIAFRLPENFWNLWYGPRRWRSCCLFAPRPIV